MDAVLDQLKTVARNSDAADRRRLLESLRDISLSLEVPQDSMQRLISGYVQIAVLKVGVDLKIFEILSASQNPVSLEELAAQTDAAPLLLGRVLRYLASTRCIAEVERNVYEKNQVTEILAMRGFQGGIHHHFDVVRPAVEALPDWLREMGYQDIIDNKQSPFQRALGTTEPVFKWLQSRPDKLANMSNYMTVRSLGLPNWLDVFPIKEYTSSLEPGQIFFVDVGGGFGHQCLALRKRLPDVPNAIMVQDLPQVLEKAKLPEGIQADPYDFYNIQPRKGARIYYMRMVLHDYPDSVALDIMKNTVASMGQDSTLLIDEVVIPDVRAHWYATQTDIIMMASVGAIERTEEQWRRLVGDAGIKLTKIHRYSPAIGGESIKLMTSL